MSIELSVEDVAKVLWWAIDQDRERGIFLRNGKHGIPQAFLIFEWADGPYLFRLFAWDDDEDCRGKLLAQKETLVEVLKEAKLLGLLLPKVSQ